MKRLLLIVLCVLTCLIFVSCKQEPDMTFEELDAIHKDYVEIIAAPDHIDAIKIREEITYDSGATRVYIYDPIDGYQVETYRLGGSAFEQSDGLTKIDGESVDALTYEEEWNKYVNTHTEWNSFENKTVKIYKAKFYGELATITFIDEILDHSGDIYHRKRTYNVNGKDYVIIEYKVINSDPIYY